MLEENVNELKSRVLVDGHLTVDDYINIDFEVCTSETSAITDRETLDSILINDYAEKEEETDEQSNDVPPEKPELSEIADTIELRECWSLFDNSGGEIRQLLSLISKTFDKHSLETKKQLKIHNFFSKNVKYFVIFQGQDLRSILFQRSTSFLYPSSVKN